MPAGAVAAATAAAVTAAGCSSFDHFGIVRTNDSSPCSVQLGTIHPASQSSTLHHVPSNRWVVLHSDDNGYQLVPERLPCSDLEYSIGRLPCYCIDD